jgi:hypothetical protein
MVAHSPRRTGFIVSPLFCTVILLLHPARASGQQGAPAGAQFDEWGQPNTLKALCHSVPLIVYAKVDATAPARLIDTKGGSPLVGQIQTLLILETLKTGTDLRVGANAEILIQTLTSAPNVRAGDQLRLLQYGGTVDVNGRKTVSAYRQKPLEVGQAAIFFLAPSHEGAWQVSWQRAGYLPIDPATQTIVLPPGLRTMDEFKTTLSLPLTRMLGFLRAFGSAGGL